MYLTPLSPVLEESLRSNDENSLTILRTADPSALKDFLIEKVIQLLLSDGRCLIVVGDREDLAIPAKILSQYKLAHLCLLWNDQDIITTKQQERFRILRNLEKTEDTFPDIDYLMTKERVLRKKIQDCTSLYEKNLSEGLSYRALLHQRKSGSIPKYTWDLSVEKFPGDGLHISANQIDSLKRSYKPYYTTYRKCSWLSESALESEKHAERALLACQKIYSDIWQSLNNLEEILSHKISVIERDILQEYQKWTEAYDRIESYYHRTENSLEKDAFSQFTEEEIPISKDARFFIIEAFSSHKISWENAPYLLSEIKKSLDQYPVILKSVIKEYFERLTPFNAEDEHLKRVFIRAQEALEQISASQWLSIERITASLSLQTLLSKMKEALGILDSASNILRDEEYLQFKLTQQNCGLTDEWLDYLTGSDSQSWSTAYYQIHYSKWLENLAYPEMQNLKKSLKTLAELALPKKKAVQDAIHNRWCQRKSQGLADLKIRYPDIYKSLFEANSTTLTIGNLFYAARDFLQSFYPVMIIRRSDLPFMAGLKEGNWSQVIFFNNSEIKLFDIQSIPLDLVDVVIASSYLVSTHELMDTMPARHFYAAERKLPYAQPLPLLHRTERYEQAISLASCILAAISHYSVYRLKNKTLVSFLSYPMNEALMSQLPEEDLNIMYEDAKDLNRLVEALIIPDSEIFILIENGLLNDRPAHSIGWQQYVINLLREAGIQILDIYTENLYKDYDRTMNDVIADLVLSNQHEGKTIFEPEEI